MKLFLFFLLVGYCFSELPDLATSKLLDIYPSNEEGKDLLRFTNAIANIGKGPLYVHSERTLNTNSDAPESKATQYIFDETGKKIDEHDIGIFVFHPEHNVRFFPFNFSIGM